MCIFPIISDQNAKTVKGYTEPFNWKPSRKRIRYSRIKNASKLTVHHLLFSVGYKNE